MIKVDNTFEINYTDQSGLSAFNRCPAKYMFSRLMGLQNSKRNTLALDYGSDMHEVLPYCYSKSTLDMAIQMFKDRWEARGHEHDDKRNVDCAENTLYDFTNTHCDGLCPYEIQHYDIKAPTKVLISKNEVPFLIDLGGPLVHAGRVDAPVKWLADDTLWALDYKTSGEVSNRFFSNFANCPQAIGYTLAMSQLTSQRFMGFIVEAIRVSKKNAESQLHLVHIKDHQIDSFITFANTTASRILLCNEKKTWPKNCAACAPYSMFGGAGYVCDYLDLCDSPDWKSMEKFYNKAEPFHPFEIDTGEENANCPPASV